MEPDMRRTVIAALSFSMFAYSLPLARGSMGAMGAGSLAQKTRRISMSV
jgi:hypothetical protein